MVYPTADLSGNQSAYLLMWRDYIEWLYAEAPWHEHELNPSTHSCSDGFYADTGLRRLANEYRPSFAPMFPDCNAAINDGVKCGNTIYGLTETAEYQQQHPANGPHFFEVTHLAFQAKQGDRRPYYWRDFLDRGPSPWWFTHAPGSGIWYDAGRTAFANFKQALVIKLVEEHINAGLTPPCDELAHIPGLCVSGSMQSFLDYFRSVRLVQLWGFPTCGGIPHCDDMDFYDSLVFYLGRVLQYDTLFITQSVLGGMGMYIGEIVDLRLPAGVEPAPWLDLNEATAIKIVDEMNITRRITLRDPLHLTDESRVLPCRIRRDNTVPPLRISCAGHISEGQAQWTPDLQNYCSPRSR